MPSTEHHGPGADDVVPDVSRALSSVNSVFGLSLILAQTSSPAQAMRLVITAVPSIAASHSAVAWHPGKSGEYSPQAPESVGSLLAGLTGTARLDVGRPSAMLGVPCQLATDVRAGLLDSHRQRGPVGPGDLSLVCSRAAVRRCHRQP